MADPRLVEALHGAYAKLSTAKPGALSTAV